MVNYAGSVQEKERKLNEMILQLQMFREHLLNQVNFNLKKRLFCQCLFHILHTYCSRNDDNLFIEIR